MTDLIYGKAYNSRGEYGSRENGNITKAYDTWNSMVTRCYSYKYQSRQPTYIGCTVAEAWLDFQNFAKWFYGHDYSNLGYHLDKDLLIPNNKIYSPETCCFVPSSLNNLLTNRKSKRGAYPQGVCLKKATGRFSARLMVDGKKKNLGYFDCPNEAHQAYKVAKEKYVKEKALEWRDRIAPNVFDALMSWQLTE